VGWLWFLGTLVPFLGIVQIWEYARADRYSYLPLSGLAIIVAWGASDLAGSRRRAPLAGVGLAAVFGLALVAWIQVGHWRNTTALFEHALAVTDDNFFAHHRLGANYLLQGRLQEAKPHFAEVFRLKPHWAQPRLQLAVLTEKLGDLEDAIALYEEAVAIDPDEATARGALGVALVRARRLADAVPHLEYAAARFPSSAMLPEALADAYFELGRPEEAIRSGEQALANAEARGERALAEQIRRGLTRYREGRPGENDGRDDPRASSR
jgi:tetratricopeptide (TPR) repeat protein